MFLIKGLLLPSVSKSHILSGKSQWVLTLLEGTIAAARVHENVLSSPVYPQMPKDSANRGSKGHKFGCEITPPSALNNKTMFLITQKMGQVVGSSQTRTLYTGLLYMWNRTEIVQF